MSANRKINWNFKHYRLVVTSLSLSLVLVFASVISALTQVSTAAAAGSIYITPANGTVVHNNNITLSLRINPTTAVTVVEATVNFNPASLQFVSVDSSGSPFDASVEQTVSASSIKISRAKLSPTGINYDALIANITFKALPYSGSSPLTLTGANAAFDGTYTNPSASGATVNFSPGTCPAGQTGTPPSCTTPPPVTTGGGTTTTTPPKTTTTPPKTTTTAPTPSTPEPVVTTQSGLKTPSISTEDIQYSIFAVTATTNIDARVRVVFGASEDQLNIQTDLTKSGTAHTITITDGLTPGSKLFYKVVATDGQTTVETTVRPVTLKGMSIKIALLDKNTKAIKNQKVTLGPTNVEATSDADGSVIFDNLMPGDYTVQITKNGQTHQQHITVESNVVTNNNGEQTSDQQLRAVIFDDYVSSAIVFPVWGWYVGGTILGLATLGALGYRSWRKNGIVRGWYARIRDFRVNQKMKGTVAGGFGPVTGLASSPDAPIGSTNAHSQSPTQPSMPTYESTPVHTVNNTDAFGSNEGRHDG